MRLSDPSLAAGGDSVCAGDSEVCTAVPHSGLTERLQVSHRLKAFFTICVCEQQKPVFHLYVVITWIIYLQMSHISWISNTKYVNTLQ